MEVSKERIVLLTFILCLILDPVSGFKNHSPSFFCDLLSWNHLHCCLSFLLLKITIIFHGISYIFIINLNRTFINFMCLKSILYSPIEKHEPIYKHHIDQLLTLFSFLFFFFFFFSTPCLSIMYFLL